ncbi:hypothetical protein Tco_1415234, partial [Tanacetum coccineum]
ELLRSPLKIPSQLIHDERPKEDIQTSSETRSRLAHFTLILEREFSAAIIELHRCSPTAAVCRRLQRVHHIEKKEQEKHHGEEWCLRSRLARTCVSWWFM